MGDSILKARIIMASRRVSASTVDWAAFARKIPATQKASFTALKQKSDGFMRAVNALPAAAPKIDFETYKSKVAVAGMVDDFQKKYEALDIPYPADNVSASLDTQLLQRRPNMEHLSSSQPPRLPKSRLSSRNGKKCVPLR